MRLLLQVLEKIKCCKGDETKTNDGAETFFKLKLKLSKNKYFFVHIATLLTKPTHVD